MRKISTETVGNFSHHYPKVAAIITASYGGRDNAMTAAWHSSISFNPPIYGVSLSPKRFTYQLIRESKEFGINLIPFEKASVAASLGGISGQKMDKFQELGLAREKGIKTGVPLLKDAYAAYECRLRDSQAYGDHIWVVGEIVATHFQEGLLTESGILDLERVKPLLYLGSEFYTTPDRDSINFIKRGIGDD